MSGLFHVHGVKHVYLSRVLGTQPYPNTSASTLIVSILLLCRSRFYLVVFLEEFLQYARKSDRHAAAGSRYPKQSGTKDKGSMRPSAICSSPTQ